MKNFRKLIIWKIAVDLSDKIHFVTEKFPREEVYNLIDQMRRSSRSIHYNISEGCGKRTTKDFIKYLYNSFGSTKELDDQIELCNKLKYISREEFNILDRIVKRLSIKLMNFIKYWEKSVEK